MNETTDLPHETPSDPGGPSLTPAQREAVRFRDGALLILAGPGSGKTRVITHRIAHLLHQGIPCDQILALTFTNKAADEMRNRVDRLAPDQPVWISTFHRFCSRLLRQHATRIGLGENFTVYDTADSLRTLRQVIQDDQVELVHFSPEGIAQSISWAKNKMITADDYVAKPGSPLGRLVSQLYPAYQRRLLASNAVDFDDLLLHAVRLLQENPDLREDLDRQYRYILVDEYQDTNLAQYVLVRSLSNHYPNLAVTGDPDQSIYGWRGANLSNILEFENDYPGVHVVRLEHNFRSTGHIVSAAGSLIAHNRRRKQKSLITDNRPGAPVRVIQYASEQAEASGIAETIAKSIIDGRRRAGDIAIFYRVNALSRTLEHALAERGLPYQIVNGTEFYQRKEVKDVLAYLQLLNNPRDDVALLRVINTPPRGIGKKTIDHLVRHARGQSLTLLQAAQNADSIDAMAKRGRSCLARFVRILHDLSEMLPCSVEAIVRAIIVDAGFEASLTDSDGVDDQERLANIQELATAARQYDQRYTENQGLDGFLEHVALVGETDNWQSESDQVTLMTLHAAKGLEFPMVYVIAVEHGLIPHERSRENENELEEERRLLFVGITRACEELQLSYTKRRLFRGVDRTTIPSPFLMELPRHELDLSVPSSVAEYRPDSPDTPHHDHDVGSPADRARRSGYAPVDASSRRASGIGITTAAALAAGSDDVAESPPDGSELKMGMLVKHAQYGLGKVIGIHGDGPKRTATIQFFGLARAKTMGVMNSPLIPIRSSR